MLILLFQFGWNERWQDLNAYVNTKQTTDYTKNSKQTTAQCMLGKYNQSICGTLALAGEMARDHLLNTKEKS